MKIIKYSYNWNNKLDLKQISWTSFRLYNPTKYKEGEEYLHILVKNGKPLLQKKGMLIYTNDVLLSQVTVPMARIDTGYGLDEFKSLMFRFYKNKGIDWNIQKLTFMLFTNKF